MRQLVGRDSFWLGLCAISLAGYLAHSESVRAFGREVSRLFVKFCS